jgi:hypothetical protein
MDCGDWIVHGFRRLTRKQRPRILSHEFTDNDDYGFLGYGFTDFTDLRIYEF